MVMFVLDYIKPNAAKNIGAFRMKNYMMFGTVEVDCKLYKLCNSEVHVDACNTFQKRDAGFL